jgi:hypothetical protein
MSVPYKALVSRISGAAARDRQAGRSPHAMAEVSGYRSTIQRLVDLKMYLAEHTEAHEKPRMGFRMALGDGDK